MRRARVRLLIRDRSRARSQVTVSPGGNLQAALDSVGNVGGGMVFGNSGNYSISTKLMVPNNTTLKGSGSSRPVIPLTGADIEFVIPYDLNAPKKFYRVVTTL